MLVRSSMTSALDRIGLDGDLTRILVESLREDDVTILEGASVDSFLDAAPDGTLRVKLKGDGGVLEVDAFLAATGRVPNTKANEALGLAAAGVALGKKGHVEVDAKCETNVPNLFAAGDATAGPALASTGVEQAQRAVAGAFGHAAEAAIDKGFPVGVWTIPEVGFFGVTAAAAEKAGKKVLEGVATYDMCLRGRVFAPKGLLKLVFDAETRQILGVHIIGRDACELVHYGMDLVMQKSSIFDVITTLFTAVTFHELYQIAALNGNGKLEFGLQWQEVLGTLGSALGSAKDLLESGQVKAKFDAIDTDGSGGLDTDELLAVLNSFGKLVPASVAANIIHLADEDGNGVVDLRELEKIFQTIARMEERSSKLGTG